MGLGSHMVEAIIREHSYRPIAGDVLTIGRQTVYVGPRRLLKLLASHGMTVDVDPGSIELDQTTIDRKSGFAHPLVADTALFGLLGARSVRALDHSPYEGAQVVHNLCLPLPSRLESITDFIVDGSTLDNVFAPSIVLQNYAKLLRPGGRLMMVNAFSAYDTAYVIMPPLWYLDYFVVNKFAACQVYVLMFVYSSEGPDQSQQTVLDNVFWLDLDQLYEKQRGFNRFVSPHHMVTILLAEKGIDSTTDRLPNQQDYRGQQEWGEYQANLDAIRKQKRPHLVRSMSKQVFTPVSGHPFIDSEYQAHN